MNFTKLIFSWWVQRQNELSTRWQGYSARHLREQRQRCYSTLPLVALYLGLSGYGTTGLAESVAHPVFKGPAQLQYRQLKVSKQFQTQAAANDRNTADDPQKPACNCTYSLPGCQGPVSGRVVDECYPQDGVSLQENIIAASCSAVHPKLYNCAEVLGQGGHCELRNVDCCGGTAQSAVCVSP